MPRFWFLVIAIWVLLLNACSQPAATDTAPVVASPAPTAAALPATAPTAAPAIVNGTLIANGRVQPVTVLDLSFVSAGSVAEVLVKPGDRVRAGDIIASLDIRTLDLALAEAKVALAEAQANYELLISGATPEQIEQAQAEIARARARLADGRTNVTQSDIAAAQAELREAREVLERLRKGITPEDRARLEAAIAEAKARLQTRINNLAGEKTQLESQIERLANELRNAQDDYSRTKWANEQIVAGGGQLTQAQIDNETRLLRAVENAERRLQEARVALETVRQNEFSEIAAYRAEVEQAEALLADALRPVTPDQIAAAEKRILQAEARLAQLTINHPNEVAVYEAELRKAEADLARLTAEPASAQIAIAQARIERAEIELRRIELNRERYQIRAPINATVVSVNAQPGQTVEASQWVVTIATLDQWQIVVPNLSEIYISLVQENDPVTIGFIALPDVRLSGRVSYIEPVGQESGIGTIYTVRITPDSWDPRLRWNMNAQVTFSAGS
ncbi:HlyD family secretion protein [Chloroflexus sp.]|uniref:HlyD family secretion protein n=1 Tax=Chloroflexus sp. TaxID=1904827 RepID=UPI002ACDCACE|nr:efflux RND transporter periplasmic adaptor subunit [Chloroflexus sp.]